jgi:DNA polymerase delta subunit 1
VFSYDSLSFTTFPGVFGYHSQRDVMFLKITVSVPRLLPVTKRVLEQGFLCPGYNNHAYQCFETNIDFDTRLVTDGK